MGRRAVILLISLVLGVVCSGGAWAHSVISPQPRPHPGGPPVVQLASLQIDAAVANGVARVRMEQRFVNQSQAPVEGVYLFPIPPGASISSFQMFVDGQAYSAEVLPADEARSIYESIVRSNRDPALLQYMGQGLLQARVFPIPAGAERLVRVEYDQVLPRDGGVWELSLPLGEEAVPQVTITANIKDLGKGTVYSPTHNVAVARHADGSASVSFEGARERGSFKLLFGKESAELGVSLLTYKERNEDGYFLLLIDPPAKEQAEVVAKDVILVIDLSGSMQGEKFDQAQGAALQILGSLGRDDRFAVVGFHSEIITYADELRGIGEVGEAMAYVGRLRPAGSTNIDGAMARAQQIAGANASRPQVIILITDGQPTVGETDPDRILAHVRAAATSSQRIFTFGVGFDVNTLLLDSISQENRGRSDYIRPGENLESAVSAFWGRVGQPVLTDVSLSWQGVKVEELYPRPLPDLYLGSQMVLLGRYRSDGVASLTLSGKVNGQVRTYSFTGLQFTDTDSDRDYIPRLWANRKVGYLLSEIRRNGANEELIHEVVALSQRFGIVTPYTSFFVNEPTLPMPAGANHRAAQQDAARVVTQSLRDAPAAGQAAVESAKQVEQIRSADTLAQTQLADGLTDQLRVAGAKSFLLREGVWVDTAYQGGQLTYLTLGSDRYLQLAASRPDLAKYLAVGSPLILVDGDTSYGIDLPGQTESQAAIAVASPEEEDPGSERPAMALPLWAGGAAILVFTTVVMARRSRGAV